MSEDELDRPLEDSAPGPTLAERMRYQADIMARQRTAIFPVPGYPSMLAVEMRAMSLEATGRIAERHKRIQNEIQRTLYIGCDIVLMATERFFEVNEDGERRELDEGTTWHSLAVAVKGLPMDTTPRVALLALLGDVNVALLVQLWDDWMSSEKVELDKEVVEDFASTP